MTDNQLPSARTDVANENLPDLHVSHMSQEDLDTLMSIFIGDRHETGTLPTFELLFSFFLAHNPDAEKVLEFFEEVEDLGYFIKAD